MWPGWSWWFRLTLSRCGFMSSLEQSRWFLVFFKHLQKVLQTCITCLICNCKSAKSMLNIVQLYGFINFFEALNFPWKPLSGGTYGELWSLRTAWKNAMFSRNNSRYGFPVGQKKQENSINQLMVQLVVWGPVVWIPGIPLWKGLLLKG